MYDRFDVDITGRVGQVRSPRYTQSGMMVLAFSVAVNRGQRTTWMEVTTFDKAAEYLAQKHEEGVFDKGVRVTITGDLVSNNWTDQNGQRRTSYQVYPRQVVFGGDVVSCARQRGNQQAQQSEDDLPPPAADEPTVGEATGEVGDDDLPF